ncbi:TIGR04219 family outer membrane beta-barrel protein [Acinetobacter lwoffii]|uniref:TIGR04219 family outer membrane beta-barrel protein n=1 Tax=Acinetobacter lwoffii TaxID=28090 RepID=UPI00209A9B46|nr:TIGR04219 family outer membrane beta-barrel protein [Acinetobacter lwoffii]MCO8097172.1 TIGR04219 family outer membrane beta-barrel protein [Acinetobacter lwoffii]
MRAKILTTLFFGFGLSTLSHADVIGVKADLSYWDFDGYSQDNNFKHELDRQGTAQLSVAVEHPVPLLPNAKIKYVNLDSNSEQSSLINASEIELNNIDYILYYELLDTIVHADIGAGLTNLDGTVKNLTTGVFTQYDLDEYSPLLYATAGVKLPFTGMSAKAEAVYSHGSDTRKTDVQAELQYDFIDNLLVDVGAKIGYRLMQVDFEQDQRPDLKLEFKGPYIGLDVHF